MRHAALWLSLGLWTGCAAVGPRPGTEPFTGEVTASFARDEMRVVETEHLRVYFPQQHRALAAHVVERLEACVPRLRALVRSPTPREKVRVFITSSDVEATWASPSIAGSPKRLVVPIRFTLEDLDRYGTMLNDVGELACHQAVHYIHMEQTDGFWRYVNLVGGEVFSPNLFMDPWLIEGLATYYEGQLPPRAGRPYVEMWRGAFDAFAAARGGALRGEDLLLSRDGLPFGTEHLVGSAFVDFLIRRYGEEKLWTVIDRQGHSVLSPLGITLRFKAVYGLDVGELLNAFSEELAARPERARPAAQQVLLDDAGYAAHLASAPDGTLALLSARHDDVTRLTVFAPDGAVRFTRTFSELLPGRRWTQLHPMRVSGLSFSADAQRLFLVAVDVDDAGRQLNKLWVLDPSGAVLSVRTESAGMGAAVMPTGHSYLHVTQEGTRATLTELHLGMRWRTPLLELGEGESIAAAAPSPDGQRVALSVASAGGVELAVLEPGGRLRPLTRDGGLNLSPRWLDAHRVVFVRGFEGRLQLFLIDVDTGALTRLTHAPYLVAEPAPLGRGRVAFLNREGGRWTVDVVAVPSPERTLAAPIQRTAAVTEPPPLPEGPKVSTRDVLEGDQPYSVLDQLFRPTLRLPLAWLERADVARGWDLGVAMSLFGSDALGFHAYGANATWFVRFNRPSVSVGYQNARWVPWRFTAQAAYTVSDPAEDLSGSVNASRTFWTTPLTFGVMAVSRRPRPGAAGGDVARFTAVGPALALRYLATDSTPYGGAVAGVTLAGHARWFPEALASTFTFGDLRAELSATVPALPSGFGAFTLSLRGRTLPDADAPLLRVGGVSAMGDPISLSAQGPSDSPALGHLPGQLAFSEPLRGFEDAAFQATSAALAGARYRIGLPVDRAWTSLLYLLPSFGVRQLELELFGEGAVAEGARPRAALGTSASLQTVWAGAWTLTVTYQFAYRYGTVTGPMHWVMVASGKL